MLRAGAAERSGLFYLEMSPLQPGWPHSQAISEVSLWFSQWVLQYFLSVIQEQAGCAHFLRSAMSSISLGFHIGNPSAWMQA